MQFWYKTALIAAILTVPLALHEGLKAQENDEETYRQLKLFGDVFERVRADYVEEVSDERVASPATMEPPALPGFGRIAHRRGSRSNGCAPGTPAAGA